MRQGRDKGRRRQRVCGGACESRESGRKIQGSLRELAKRGKSQAGPVSYPVGVSNAPQGGARGYYENKPQSTSTLALKGVHSAQWRGRQRLGSPKGNSNMARSLVPQRGGE